VSDALDRLVREARADLGTRAADQVDWARVDRELFRRIEAEKATEQLSSSRGRGWAITSGALAAAAAVAFVVAKSGTMSTEHQRGAAAEAAGIVAAIEGGALLVDDKAATVGVVLHEGDSVDARAARATVDRPGKLTFVLERGAQVGVTHVQSASLVVALQEGAVEADVVPVANGEAFAVDVGSSRVAVHGTHLRVARSGEHVVVDLNEGVVSLGDAPRAGSTLGVLITAPAHAEFTAGQSETTLIVTHDPAAVRQPMTITAADQPTAVSAIPGPARLPAMARQTGPVGHVAAGPAPTATQRPAPVAPAAPAPVVEVDPTTAIAAAVRSCFRDHLHGDGVTLVVNTTVHLELGEDGSIRTARFDPPVAPDVNSCAGAMIYRVRFGHGGSEAIPVNVTIPSSAP
jgi:ferric-dicitrate binding protein FerR (iron transport regulator)